MVGDDHVDKNSFMVDSRIPTVSIKPIESHCPDDSTLLARNIARKVKQPSAEFAMFGAQGATAFPKLVSA